ncbi:MAG: hypothetical protein K8F27_12285, partial [Sulfuricellaceae bacterium]|nr:hypothetical protein [Sulfuricellaceae bacterium]
RFTRAYSRRLALRARRSHRSSLGSDGVGRNNRRALRPTPSEPNDDRWLRRALKARRLELARVNRPGF